MYKSKMYAKALVYAILNEKIDDKKIIHNFLKLLEKDGNLKDAEKIVILAQRYYLEKMGNKIIILETARKVDIKDLIKSFVKAGDILEEKINPELIAGVKIIINNENQLDNSFLGKLNKI